MTNKDEDFLREVDNYVLALLKLLEPMQLGLKLSLLGIVLAHQTESTTELRRMLNSLVEFSLEYHEEEIAPKFYHAPGHA